MGSIGGFVICHLGCEFAGFGAQLFSILSIRVMLCRGLGVFGGSFTSVLQHGGQTLHCINWGATLHHVYDNKEQLCHIYNIREQLGNVWGVEFYHLGVQLCSILGAESHPVYNIRIQCCTFYTTGVQLCLRYVRFVVFRISGNNCGAVAVEYLPPGCEVQDLGYKFAVLLVSVCHFARDLRGSFTSDLQLCAAALCCVRYWGATSHHKHYIKEQLYCIWNIREQLDKAGMQL